MKQKQIQKQEQFASLVTDWFVKAPTDENDIKPRHTALYVLYLHNTLINNDESFLFEAKDSVDCTGIKSFKQFKRTLADLIEWGFILFPTEIPPTTPY